MKTPSKEFDNKTKILIVEDHPLVRKGLAQLIDQEQDVVVCGEAESSMEALQACKVQQPELAIIDLSLKESSGLELIKTFQSLYPNIKILVLSMHDEHIYAQRCIQSGARGYITKLEASEKVLEAIRHILNGRIYLSEDMSTTLLSNMSKTKSPSKTSPIEQLSDRELEVFELIGNGLSTHEIADQLHLSIKTIETYRAHLKDKLNLKNASQLIQAAVSWFEKE